MEKEIVIIQKGAIDAEQIQKLEAKGYTVVVVVNISKIKTISQLPKIADSEILKAALAAIEFNGSARASFADNIIKACNK